VLLLDYSCDRKMSSHIAHFPMTLIKAKMFDKYPEGFFALEFPRLALVQHVKFPVVRVIRVEKIRKSFLISESILRVSCHVAASLKIDGLAVLGAV
jgi:hypothetical protein